MRDTTNHADLMSDRAKNRLREIAGISGPCEFEVLRTSKWGVQVSLLESPLCVHSIFKIDVRTGKIEKTL